MKKRAYELVEQAEEARESDELDHAGALYTAAAHEYAGEVVEHNFPEPDLTTGAVSRLGFAATCYRIINSDFKVENRCDLGILLCEDYIEYIDQCMIEPGSFADLRRGAWKEYIGDLRTIACRKDAGEAYEEAISIYSSAGDWDFMYGEQEHMRLAAFYRSIRQGLGHDIPEVAPEEQAPGTTFSEWVEYKQEKLPKYLSQLEAQGSWPTQIDQS